MQLIYLYFTYSKHEKVFEDRIEMNFDSQLRFKMKNGSLVKDNPVDDLPPGFFSVLPEYEKSPVVDDVSVVVGGNGVGKTSIVEVLRDIIESNTAKFDQYILVYRVRGEDFCRCKYHGTVQLPKDVIKDDDKRLPQLSWDFIYITPHFNHNQLLMLGDANKFLVGQYQCVDLSPLALMESCVNRTSNPKPRFFRQHRGLDSIGAYLAEQQRWMFEFIGAKENLPIEKRLPIEKQLLRECVVESRNSSDNPNISPYGVTVAIDTVVDRKLMVGDVSTGVRNILKKIKMPNTSFFTKAFYAYAGLYLIDNSPTPAQRPRIPEEMKNDNNSKWTKEAWGKLWWYRRTLLEFCLREEVLNNEIIFDFFKKCKQHEGEQREIVVAEKCFQQIDRFERLTVKNKSAKRSYVGERESCQLTLTGQEFPDYMKEILALVDLHFKAKSILSFLSFSPYPRMSAGELSFLSTWGRLYNYYIGSVGAIGHDFAIKKRVPARPQDQHAIVFFDEAETTMHPDWQRRIVQYTIWFFEAFVPWVHPHIIFATHSPILLSDVPIGNVVLLDKGVDGKSHVENSLKRENTFAANIFDLYKESFFMRNGLVGVFAQGKVDQLLRKIQNIVSEKKKERIVGDEWALTKLIGDPNVRQYFVSIQQLVDRIQESVNQK